MKMNFEEFLKGKYGLNEPIYVEDIQFESYSRSWIFKELKRLVDAGTLKRFEMGVYYFPIKMSFGDSRIDPRKVVQKRFLSDGVDVYGYISGLSLLNAARLSTQCPNLLEVVTNREASNVRDIRIGSQRVRARKPRTTVTKENVSALQFLELMNNIDPKFMDETERFMLKKYVDESGVSREQISLYAGLFPAKAMRNFVESGAAYEIAY
jgi:DNA-binding Lrp family transcriptional regulator